MPIFKSLNKFLTVGDSDRYDDVMSSGNDVLKNVNFKIDSNSNEFKDVEDVIKTLVDETDITNENDISNIFKDIQVPADILKKYNVIDDLKKSLQLIKNIIKVYRNNILMTDGIKYNFLFYKPTEFGESNEKDSKQYIIKAKEIIDYFDYSDKLKNKIVPNLLTYGKCFVEVLNVDDIKINYASYLTENEQKTRNIKGTVSKLKEIDILLNNNNINEDLKESHYNLLSEHLIDYDEDVDIESEVKLNSTLLDIEYYDENVVDIENEFDFLFENFKKTDEQLTSNKKPAYIDKLKSNKFNKNLSNVFIKIHDPRSIVELKNENDVVFGYIEIKNVTGSNDMGDKDQNILNIVNKLNTTILNDKKCDRDNNSIQKLTDSVLKKILKQYGIKIKNKYKDDIKLSDRTEKELKEKLGPEILNNLKKIILMSNDDDKKFKKLNVKFIFPSDMIKYDIGEGVVEKLIYPGKLYLLTQLSNIMMKISRAPLTRIWKVESGMRTDYRKIVESMKSRIRNTRTSAEQFLSTSGAKYLTDFRDQISILNNGKEVMSPEIQQYGNSNIKTQDLEDLRREIIGLSGVPGPLLGFSDGGGELREHLVYTNINFATEIINIQEVINKANNKLINKISNLSDNKNKNADNNKMKQYVNLSLLPPVVLLLQLIEGTLGSIERIHQTFKNAEESISFKYLVKTFCPYLDYTEIEQIGTIEDIKKAGKLAQQASDGY